MPSDRDALLSQLEARLSEIIDADTITAVTDADLSSLRKQHLKQLCAHFRLDFGGNKNDMKDRLRRFREDRPPTPPPEERKQPAIPFRPQSPSTYAEVTAQGRATGKSVSSPRSIAAVKAVDNMESEASLAEENIFLEGELMDQPGTTDNTATEMGLSAPQIQDLLTSPHFTTAVTTQIQQAIQHTFQPNNMPLIGLI